MYIEYSVQVVDRYLSLLKLSTSNLNSSFFHRYILLCFAEENRNTRVTVVLESINPVISALIVNKVHYILIYLAFEKDFHAKQFLGACHTDRLVFYTYTK